MRRVLGDTQGAEIAEAAAVLPLMFMIILGIFWFGQAFSIYGTITRAAQEGARAGAAPYCATCAAGNTPATNAYNAVEAALVAAKLDASNARRVGSGLNSCSGPAPSCSGVSSQICIETGVQLSNTTGGATGVCGVSVSFQYPFKFPLPGASIGNQQIWMTASARARMESQ